MTTKLISIYN